MEKSTEQPDRRIAQPTVTKAVFTVRALSILAAIFVSTMASLAVVFGVVKFVKLAWYF